MTKGKNKTQKPKNQDRKQLFLERILPPVILAVIILIGGFFRFYRISEYMTFLGDEGRDMLVVKRMIVDHKPTLLGPITSVGSMYMGPVYYYMMVPFLWLWSLDPVGPSIMVAVLSLLTIILIFRTCADFFSVKAGLIAAFLYSISPLAIIYGKSSWNPNVVPFFSMLLIYSVLKTVIGKKHNWLIVSGLSLGILLQLHYVTFMFFIILPVIFFHFRPVIPKKTALFAFLAFLFAYFPFILFELRHGFVNSQSVMRFVFNQKRSPESSVLISFFFTVFDVAVRLFWRLVVISSAELAKILIASTLIIFLKYRIKIMQGSHFGAVKVIMIWTIVGILSYGLYRGVIYDYYFGSLFPAPFIITGILLGWFYSRGRLGSLLTLVALIVLTFFNLEKNPLRVEPNNMLKNTKTIADSVIEKTGGKPYNFALIATMNSDHAYRYFLEASGKGPTVIEPPDKDPERKSVTSQLFVVCEEKVCQPLGHPLWEIAGFGRAEIEQEWNSVTVKVFRMVPYKKGG